MDCELPICTGGNGRPGRTRSLPSRILAYLCRTRPRARRRVARWPSYCNRRLWCPARPLHLALTPRGASQRMYKPELPPVTAKRSQQFTHTCKEYNAPPCILTHSAKERRGALAAWHWQRPRVEERPETPASAQTPVILSPC